MNYTVHLEKLVYISSRNSWNTSVQSWGRG